MIWLTYRQLRAQTLAALIAVVAVAVTLGAHRARIPAAVQGIDEDLLAGLSVTDRRLYFVGVVLLAVVPALLGAFWGAPLVARELESGTYRLVWNQSVTRARWLAVKLAITCAAAAAVTGALSLAITRWSRVVDAAAGGRDALPARLTPVSFAMRGVVPIAYAVFAVVLGVAVGLVLRRVLPAVAVTLALFVAVQVVVPHMVRPHLLSPTQKDVAFSRETLDGIRGDPQEGVKAVHAKAAGSGSWVLSHQLIDESGRATTLPTWFAQCLPRPGPRQVDVVPVPKVQGKGGLDGCLDRLGDEGYRDRVRYFTKDRFWALQWAETILFGVVSAGLVGFCFWWTRRRIG